MMFHGMTSAQTLGMFSICVLIGAPVIILLTMWSASRWPGYDREREPHSQSSLGAPAAFREPADLAEVDARARWFARVAVDPFVAPAPLPVATAPALDMTPLVGARIDELFRVSVSSLNSSGRPSSVNPASRYYRPSVGSLVAEVRTATPARHVESVGRHRARELVAA
jgi:hypothetical protein